MFCLLWAALILSGIRHVAGFAITSPMGSNFRNKFHSKLSSSNSINIPSQESWDVHNGVLKIPSAISSELSDSLFDYITDQKIQAWLASQTASSSVENDEANAEEQQNTLREREMFGHRHQTSKYACDLQLSLLRGGFAADFGKSSSVSDGERHVLVDFIRELLVGNESTVSSSPPLAEWMEHLVTEEGDLCEMAAWVTEPGYEGREAYRAVVANDDDCDDEETTGPIYTIAVAMQDINENMGCMNFLRGTHLLKATEVKGSTKLPSSPFQCNLKKGDAVLYDARILQSSEGNDATLGSSCTLLQLSFCNPKFKKDSTATSYRGYTYTGSLRPGYVGAINLGDWKKALLKDNTNADNGKDLFEAYGDGILQNFHNIDSTQEEK